MASLSKTFGANLADQQKLADGKRAGNGNASRLDRCKKERGNLAANVALGMQRVKGISPEALLREDDETLKLIDHVRV